MHSEPTTTSMDSNNLSDTSSSGWLSHNSLSEFEYAFFCVQVTLCIIGILGNSLVCITIAKATFMQNVTNFLIAHLAVADILVCVTLIAFQERYSSGLVDGNNAHNEIFCKLFHAQRIVWGICELSIFSMVGVTVERYVGIVHPLKYPRLFTRVKVGILIIVIWTISISLTVPSLAASSYDSSTNQCFKQGLPANSSTRVCLTFLCILEVWLPLVILFGCYVKILISLQRAARSQQRDNNHAPANELLAARRRVVKLLLIVSVIYFLVWLPVFCIFVILFFFSNISFEVYNTLYSIKPTIAVLNSVVNPFVYAFKYKEFQRGVRYHVFSCRCHSRRVTAAVSTVTAD